MTSEWVPFSHRYGLASAESALRWDTASWRVRHSPDLLGGEAPDLLRCVCPAATGRTRCADYASQEDRLCDACREHCFAVTEGGERRRLVDVHGAGA